jgi:Fic family protein
LKELGPFGKGEGIDENGLKLKLKAITKLTPYIRLVENERLSIHFDTIEEYKEFYSSEELDRLFRELIAEKLAISQIMLLLRERPLSTGEISKILGLTPSEITRHLNSSARQGLVRYEESQWRFALA